MDTRVERLTWCEVVSLSALEVFLAEALDSMEDTTMCWTRTDRHAEGMENERFATKKDEGDAFRTGQTGDTPKPRREEVLKDRELAEAK